MRVQRQAVGGMTWARGRARFEKGDIVLDPKTLTEYQPFADRRINFPFELAAVRSPQDAVAFARRFGLLQAHEPDDLRESWHEWERQASLMQTLLAIYTHLREAVNGDAVALARVREAASRPEMSQLFRPPAQNDEQALAQASKLVEWGVTNAMADVRLGVQSEVGLTMADGRSGEPGGFALSAQPPDLLSLIYYIFALFISRSEPARVCEGCGRIFPVADPRQRYHDQQCAQRTRYRRWADKRREER